MNIKRCSCYISKIEKALQKHPLRKMHNKLFLYGKTAHSISKAMVKSPYKPHYYQHWLNSNWKLITWKIIAEQFFLLHRKTIVVSEQPGKKEKRVDYSIVWKWNLLIGISLPVQHPVSKNIVCLQISSEKRFFLKRKKNTKLYNVRTSHVTIYYIFEIIVSSGFYENRSTIRTHIDFQSLQTFFSIPRKYAICHTHPGIQSFTHFTHDKNFDFIPCGFFIGFAVSFPLEQNPLACVAISLLKLRSKPRTVLQRTAKCLSKIESSICMWE